MWKNKKHSSNINGIYYTYQVKGLNLDRFINLLKKRQISLYNLRKTQNNQLIVSVCFKDRLKFFAIAKEMCYNVKKVREFGKAYPFLALYRSIGIFIGCLIIYLMAVFSNGYIFSVNYSGSGSVYKRQVDDFLSQKGITRFSKFNQLDLGLLADEILANNKHLSFVSCQKNGNTLNIQLVLSQEKVERLDGNVGQLNSDKHGVVEEIKVYRGTQKVSVGQEVNVGDLLVDGLVIIKDQPVSVNVIAHVSLICTQKIEYISQKDGQEEQAILFALEQNSQLNILDSSVEKIKKEDKVVYLVNLYYRHILQVG